MRFKDLHGLLLIILAAFTVRVFTLWAGRPEFTVWFNHNYYYWVEVRGLMENGSLPYRDMPLLFHLYALTTRAFIGLGLVSDPNTAIVNSTRFIMCLVPALIPIPIYGITKNIQGLRPIRRSHWILILLSGFLPLSVSHMPELMQKNMLGLLLLSMLIFYSQKLFREFNTKDFFIAAVLALLIVLSHYGTFGAMLLYGVAAFTAYAIAGGGFKKIVLAGFGLTVSGFVAIALIYFIDAQRFRRIFIYLGDSFGHSLVASVFKQDSRLTETLVLLGGILLFYSLLFLAYRVYVRHKSSVSTGTGIFMLTNIIFSGLLVLPIFEQHLMGRLVVFVSIPLLIVFINVHQYGTKMRWLKTASVALVATAVTLLAFGEVVDSRLRSRNHEAVLADINDLQTQQQFQPNDLIITKTGAEHICNWFYGVKSGVITSLTLEDFARYDNVYILNPIEGELNFDGIWNKTITSEADKYLFMLRNIPRPDNINLLFRTENIEFFKLDKPPDDWIFTAEGHWNGYAPGSRAPSSSGLP